MTRQRRVILEQLRAHPGHPTADELFRAVREQLPHVSLATVYRNLEVLCQAGLVRQAGLGGAQRRYDSDCHEHQHVRCLSCGRVDDVHSPGVDLTGVHARTEQGAYQLSGYALEFQGICPDCQRNGRQGE